MTSFAICIGWKRRVIEGQFYRSVKSTKRKSKKHKKEVHFLSILLILLLFYDLYYFTLVSCRRGGQVIFNSNYRNFHRLKDRDPIIDLTLEDMIPQIAVHRSKSSKNYSYGSQKSIISLPRSKTCHPRKSALRSPSCEWVLHLLLIM